MGCLHGCVLFVFDLLCDERVWRVVVCCSLFSVWLIRGCHLLGGCLLVGVCWLLFVCCLLVACCLVVSSLLVGLRCAWSV